MKSLKTLGAVALLSTSMLGAATSFAATPESPQDTAKTPVQTKFKVSEDGTTNEKPENPSGPDDQNPDGNKPLDPKGPFGIAYVPNRLFTQNFDTGETLNESGTQEFTFKNTDAHVGVKDKTHTSGGWTLKAKLEWDTPLAGSSIVANTGSGVQINKGGQGSTPTYESTSDVTTQPTLTINNQDSEIMTGKNLKSENKVYNNTFDTKLGDAKLRIADTSQIAVGEYTGNVVWTLTAAAVY